MQLIASDDERAQLAQTCPLARLLAVCLRDAEEHISPAAAPLREALQRLGFDVRTDSFVEGECAADKAALAVMLEYLLPELETRCTEVAKLVRAAIALFRRPPAWVAERAGMPIH